MQRNLILLESYECHMISDKVLFPGHNTFISKATRLLLLMFIVFVSKLHAQNPVASFSVPSSQGCVPFNVQFNNTSQNGVSYQWSFGNGNTSTLVNPSNVFTVAGTYTVTLTAFNSSGSSNSYSSQIVVQPKPAANFSVDINSGCQNSQIFTFTNLSTNFDSCNWDFGDGATSNVLNPQHIYNISGTFSVILVVYNKQYGCSDVYVLNTPIVVFSKPSAVISVNDTATCDKQMNFQFNASVSNAVSWTWLFGDGTISQQLNPSHVYNDTGYFNVSLILISSNGCVDTIVKDNFIHIKWNPIPLITVSDDSGCKPFYLALMTSYYAGASYSWNLGNGVIKSSSSVYYTYPDSGIFPVTLTVSYSNGCSQFQTAGPISVFPRPSFSYSLSNGMGCAPLPVQFTISTTGGPYTWLWDFGDGQTSNQFNPVHVYTGNGNYQVNLEATSINGCKLGYPLNGFVKVFSPEAIFTPDVTSGCAPLLVNFNNQSINASSWLWQFGDGATSTVQHPSHTYTNNGTYQVRLIVNDVNGCSDTLVYPVQINVSQGVVNYIPQPPIQGCAPYAVNFSDASGAASYLWDFGDGTTSTLSNPYHIYIEPGTYTVSLTTWMPNGGCEQYIANFQTFIIDGAAPGFTYTVSPCPPFQVFFNDTSLNAASWQWSFGDGGTSNIQHPTHSYPGPGTYNVVLAITTPSGCITTLQANNSVQIIGLGASASAITTDTAAPVSVQFYANSSAATWWLWSFGDGDSSNLENPIHVYNSVGPFTITLTIGNDSCVYTYTYPPIKFGSSFGQSGGGLGGVITPPPRVYHCAPYTVKFTNPDPSALSILWDFGDGNTSNLSSPEHVYFDSGAFITTVYLNYGGGIIDSIVYSDTLYVVEPISDFNIATTNLCNGVIVDVQTLATASIYDWDFGNGISASSATASCTYPNVNASYMISLNVTDTNNCSSFIAKSFAVNATSPLTSNKRRVCAGDLVIFDPGNVNYMQYSWDFGDGTLSTLKRPVHAYQDSGLYLASLVVTDINGCQLTFNMTYSIQVFKPIADFVISSVTANCLNVSVSFSDTSTGNTSIKWMFGDGTSSNQSSVVHLYTVPGYYDVTLIAFNNVCSDTMILPAAVYVSDLEPVFSYNIINDCSPAIVSFTDMSVDAVSWQWDFGDGDTSSLQNPTHTYQKNPVDSVVLTVKDINGCTKSVALPAPQITTANFSVDARQGCIPLNVSFADSSSNAVSWQWDFGDGATSNLPSPSHAYTTDGYYSVSLIVTSATGCKDTLTIDSLIEVNTPNADFSYLNVAGCTPLLVNFTDLSSNVIKWTWDFGNSSTSGNQHPSLIYITPGVYTVSLFVENKFGCVDSVTYNNIIHVLGATPSFNMSVVSGCVPLTVSFNNLTSGSVAWEWQFGDGTTDSVFNPVHIYQDTGSYTVTLFAYDSSGCITDFTYPATIDVGFSPVLDYSIDVTSGCTPLTITLDDAATIADSLVWYMGDGTILNGRNPVHTYQQPGFYIVKLVAFTAAGCSDSLVYQDTVKVYLQPEALFSADVLEGCSPVLVNFVNESSNLSNPSFEWEFGNGTLSTQTHPQYTYLNQGVYTITLIVTNEYGCSDTLVKTDYINVYDQNPPPVTDLYRVTVDAPDQIFLEWSKTTVNDLDYYIVYRFNKISAVYDSVGQVFQNNTGVNGGIPFYLDTNVITNAETYSYKVQAVDKCGLRQDLISLRAHETILLSTIGAHQQVSLSWTPYGGCSVSGYEVYRKDLNNGFYQLIAALDSQAFAFTDSSAGCPVSYTYKVIGVDICGDPVYQSSSNESTATPTSDVDDQFVDVVRSTVVDDEFVLTEWGEPSILPVLVDRYDVYRSTDQINYQLIATVPASAHEYSDFDVNVDDQEYYYKIFVQNICNVEAKEGYIGSSILLQRIEMGPDYILKWTKYQHWNSGVESYVIEKLNSNGTWEEIERLPGTVTEWEEK